MAQPNSQTTRELAKLEDNVANIKINNSHITCSKSENASQTSNQTEGGLLLPVQV